MFFFNSTSHTINYNYKHPRHIQLPTYASSRNTQWHRKRNSVRLSLCFISSHVSSFALFLPLSVCWFARFLSLHLSVCPFVCQSVYLTVRLFCFQVCLSVCFVYICLYVRLFCFSDSEIWSDEYLRRGRCKRLTNQNESFGIRIEIEIEKHKKSKKNRFL